jgi:hypothetical protein
MHLYMSGTPNNDVYQVLENRLNSHCLFSMHPNYLNFVPVPGHWGTLPVSMKGARNGTAPTEVYG